MANSAFYRVTYKPVESIERAVVILGSDGLRSLMAAALMQPIFKVSSAAGYPRFADTVWEHALRSAHAAIPHAALVERADPFAAELLSLVSGLAEIVIFRAAVDNCSNLVEARARSPGAHLAAGFAVGRGRLAHRRRLGAFRDDDGRSRGADGGFRAHYTARSLTALRPLRRRPGVCCIPTAVIDDATVRMSLPEAGLSPAHLKCMWTRLLHKHEDPRISGKGVEAGAPRMRYAVAGVGLQH